MRLNAHPTFLIRSEEHGTPGPVSLRRLMVLLESSPLAEAAVPVATDLAGATSALLVLVRVRPFATPMWLPDARPEAITEMEATDVADAEQYVAGVRRGIPPAVRADSKVLRGSAALELPQFASEADIGPVVITTHGRGGFRRLVLGSVADRMVRAGLPVLLVQPSPAAPTAVHETALHCVNCRRLVTTSPTMRRAVRDARRICIAVRTVFVGTRQAASCSGRKDISGSGQAVTARASSSGPYPHRPGGHAGLKSRRCTSGGLSDHPIPANAGAA
jgi:nucleotide-binding universal stress UspA family protein